MVSFNFNLPQLRIAQAESLNSEVILILIARGIIHHEVWEEPSSSNPDKDMTDLPLFAELDFPVAAVEFLPTEPAFPGFHPSFWKDQWLSRNLLDLWRQIRNSKAPGNCSRLLK